MQEQGTMLLEPDNWLDDMLLDLYITRLKYRAYSQEYQWKKFIRS